MRAAFKWIGFLFAAFVLFSSCSNNEKLIEKVFVVNIKPGDEKLNEYLEYHRKIWPEVEKGFERAGYKQIRLYRSLHTLVMVITVPEGADLDAMGKAAEAYNVRCKEWNTLMETYQEGVAGTVPGQTWTEATSFYHYKGK